MNEGDRLLLRTAVQNLADRAVRERGEFTIDAPERQFLLGVEAATLEVLHPEAAFARSDDWLSRERGEFRDGYFRTRTALADVSTSGRVPASIPLPRMNIDRGRGSGDVA